MPGYALYRDQAYIFVHNQKNPLLHGQYFLNMEIKMQAPDFIIPEEKLYDRNELLKELEVNKLYLTRIINCKPLDEACMDFEFPTFGFLTRYEWIQFILFHVQRHTIQLQNILSTHKK